MLCKSYNDFSSRGGHSNYRLSHYRPPIILGRKTNRATQPRQFCIDYHLISTEAAQKPTEKGLFCEEHKKPTEKGLFCEEHRKAATAQTKSLYINSRVFFRRISP
jgi:hypothetical protein